MPAASEQISAGMAPIHFVGAAIQAAHCRLFAPRQPMSLERRPAMRAETLQTDVSAIGSLSIFCRFAGQEHERAWKQCAMSVGARAKMPFPVHPHMLRHGCGYALANAGHDTRSLQAYLGHKNIQHTVRYTELAPDRFRDFWR
jgi:hypothetical protein